jgi:hypothetical protein
LDTTTTNTAHALTGEAAEDHRGHTYFRIALTGQDGQGRFAIVDGVGLRKLRQHGATSLYLVNDGQGREYVTFVGTGDGARRKRAMTAARVIMGDPQGARIEHVSGDRLDLRRSNLRVRQYEGVGEPRAKAAA